jgi:hypothetical protein
MRKMALIGQRFRGSVAFFSRKLHFQPQSRFSHCCMHSTLNYKTTISYKPKSSRRRFCTSFRDWSTSSKYYDGGRPSHTSRSLSWRWSCQLGVCLVGHRCCCSQCPRSKRGEVYGKLSKHQFSCESPFKIKEQKQMLWPMEGRISRLRVTSMRYTRQKCLKLGVGSRNTQNQEWEKLIGRFSAPNRATHCFFYISVWVRNHPRVSVINIQSNTRPASIV